MAKRNSTSEAHARSKDFAKQDNGTPGSDPRGGKVSTSSRFEDIVADERMRLMKAYSILQCVMIAMEAEQSFRADGPYWPSIVESAMKMINESIRRLDGQGINVGLSP